MSHDLGHNIKLWCLREDVFKDPNSLQSAMKQMLLYT